MDTDNGNSNGFFMGLIRGILLVLALIVLAPLALAGWLMRRREEALDTAETRMSEHADDLDDGHVPGPWDLSPWQRARALRDAHGRAYLRTIGRAE